MTEASGLMEASGEGLSYGRRIAQLAERHPAKPAIIFVWADGAETTITWDEYNRESNRVARLLAEHGVDDQSMVAIGLPNCPEHYLAAAGAWKLGACVLPLSAALPQRERDGILEVSGARLVVADWEDVRPVLLRRADLARRREYSDEPLPDKVPDPGYAMGSGGSTGRSKVIVIPRPWVYSSLGLARRVGMRTGQVQLIAGRLYHNSPFGFSHHGLMDDHTLVVMEQFDAAQAVDLIERHRVQFGFLVPTIMRRILELPDIKRRGFASVEAFFHTAAPCPPWLKRAWIDLIGPERLWEAYGATEATGATVMRSDEWLEHPGSVGRPIECDLRILDENLQELPPGEVGEIFMRPKRADGPTYRYLGSPPLKSTPDGFMSVGDLGWVDDQGYLFLADRRVDMIITGGANVFPAEVEAALSEHPQVMDVAVIGVPDEEWGRRVHAIVQPRDPARPPSPEALDVHCRERLAPYKAPKSYEFVAALGRDPSGKMRRSAMVAERESGWSDAMRRPQRAATPR